MQPKGIHRKARFSAFDMQSIFVYAVEYYWQDFFKFTYRPIPPVPPQPVAERI